MITAIGTAIALGLPAIGGFIIVVRKLNVVHDIVNSAQDRLMARLEKALGERDEAREQNRKDDAET